ncbi:hypothetical protein EYC84_004292 [Monilinia fructicola]|uniref:Uncharacterized protein n=1 Tax=Monilinia fructicola TaxID=38448 RepID=A0A5M9K892_MONFR|nr:hypothetical protein EYC84_004292 [Monilinia fructicola]
MHTKPKMPFPPLHSTTPQHTNTTISYYSFFHKYIDHKTRAKGTPYTRCTIQDGQAILLAPKRRKEKRDKNAWKDSFALT